MQNDAVLDLYRAILDPAEFKLVRQQVTVIFAVGATSKDLCTQPDETSCLRSQLRSAGGSQC